MKGNIDKSGYIRQVIISFGEPLDTFLVIVLIGAVAALIFCLIFRVEVGGLMKRLSGLGSAKVSITRDGFQAELSELAFDTAAVEEAEVASNPMPIAVTAAEDVFAQEEAEMPSEKDSQTPVNVGQFLAVGANWGGLIAKAKHLLDQHDIPRPENDSSLGELLQSFEEEWPSILSPKAAVVANRADQILDTLMTAQASDINHEEIRLFTNSLDSLHRIVGIAESKARHPAHQRRS